MWKLNNFVSIFTFAIICIVMTACGGSDPVDVT